MQGSIPTGSIDTMAPGFAPSSLNSLPTSSQLCISKYSSCCTLEQAIYENMYENNIHFMYESTILVRLQHNIQVFFQMLCTKKKNHRK